MKKRIYKLMCAVAFVLATGSCSDWFDVSPKTNIKAEELFETETGFYSALTGIYVSMTESAAYGNNLSFGMLDQLAQLYDVVPDGTSGKADIYMYDATTDGGYNTKHRLASTWSKAYNIIANTNNLLKWLDKNGAKVIVNPQTRNMMYGEAYAIRAYIHFDLLRCWGPMSYAEEASTECIPYRLTADNSKQPLLSANTVADKVLADLALAEQYLDYEKGVSLSNSDRRFRFNYYAVKALEARVYNYKGDNDNALSCANEVINGCGLTLQTENQEDPVLFNETLCALNLYKMDENITSYFSTGPKFTTQYYTNFNTYRTLFGATGTSADVDMRAKSGAIFVYNAAQVISRKYIKNDNGVIPLIRLPEMYYIKCEASPLADAPQYINSVRSRRGYTIADSYKQFANNNERTEALNLEYRKEFYAEGQYFYFLKRNGYSDLDYSPEIKLGKAQYVFPLPDAEKEYGWTSGENAE